MGVTLRLSLSTATLATFDPAALSSLTMGTPRGMPVSSISSSGRKNHHLVCDLFLMMQSEILQKAIASGLDFSLSWI
jgi:hypothetical protein